MPLPELIQGDTDACSLAGRWVLDPRLAELVVEMVRRTQEKFTSEGLRWPDVYIISGYRTEESQSSIYDTDPTLGQIPSRSCHTVCPALAVDLRLGNIEWPPDSVVPGEWGAYAIMGGIWELMGGRWGGRFSQEKDSLGGFTSTTPHNVREQNHFDLGPCL